MGLTYSVTVALGNFSAFKLSLLIPYGITFAAFVIYYIAAIIKGFRDKHSGMPWQTNMWNMANDFCFVFLGFSFWWTPGLETNHWFTHIIWAGMVAWFAAEIILHVQAAKWDMDEIFPHTQKRSTRIIFYVLIQVIFIACYYWVWTSINDPLVQIMIGTTVSFCTLFMPYFMSVRNSTKGISVWSLWAVLIAQVAFFWFALPAMDPIMGTVYTYLFGACGVGTGIFSLWKFYAMKKEGR